MIRRRLTNAIPMMGLFLLLSNNAFAEYGLKDNIEINVFGAGSFWSSKHYIIGFPQSPTSIPGKLQLDSAGRFGARLGVYTRGHWGQEFYYSYEPNGVTLSQAGPFPKTTNFRVGISNYGINGLYYLAETESHSFQPFVSAGLGGTLYSIRQASNEFLRNPALGNIPDADNSNELAFNFGFGFKTRSTGWLGVRFDARDYLGRAPSFGLARQSNNPTATVLPDTGAINNAEVSIGLVFYFGRR
jgi:hypothetical protein